jgi:hypothetical protein
MTRTAFHSKIRQTGPPGGGFGNTADPSEEIVVGDKVTIHTASRLRTGVQLFSHTRYSA